MDYNLDCVCWGQECNSTLVESCEGCETYVSYEDTMEYQYPE